ncbi:type II toxin-antitoxin system VapC family toxin [Lacipirellula parvula]|uniref:Ribonuclease VapC n=1 Tax=Lacipirellula parvula TaxID=2650471 RepID=A0A5K7X9K3_9BACT|nr:PIN domain-containing protein [Lacipirellula parvula]BBO31006.1 hypothetical protein PLANPX_0618 [Lacipirellula parvula]
MIFIDTSALLARYVERDQHFAAARECWAELLSSETMLVTSCHVVVETLTLLGRRTDYKFAAERARRLYASTQFTILRATEQSEIDAVAWFERMAGVKASFTDCISFSLMQRLGISDVFTFDDDFTHAGFRVIPNRKNL